MGLELLTLAGLGFSAYSGYKASRQKPKSPPVSPPAVPQSGEEAEQKTKVRKYRPAAQLFSDEELRLGRGGRLGGIAR